MNNEEDKFEQVLIEQLLTDREDQIKDLEEEILKYRAWIAEIFQKLYIPYGDMGALENLVNELHNLREQIVLHERITAKRVVEFEKLKSDLCRRFDEDHNAIADE